MKFDLVTFWPYLVLLALILATLIVNALTNLKNSPLAKKYAVLGYLSQLGIDIGNDALALLQANPTALTPAQALAWAENELSKTIPADIVALVADLDISNAARRGLITAANQATASDVTKSVQTALQPTPGTVRAFPPAGSGQSPATPATLAARLTELEKVVFADKSKGEEPVSSAYVPKPADPIATGGSAP
jgi:hypothetical protein